MAQQDIAAPQNARLARSSMSPGKGLMQGGLSQAIKYVFRELKQYRLEANRQHDNHRFDGSRR